VRWIIIKLIDFFIVLAAVTLIVAAIFTGPMSTFYKSMAYQNVQMALKAQLQNLQSVKQSIIAVAEGKLSPSAIAPQIEQLYNQGLLSAEEKRLILSGKITPDEAARIGDELPKRLRDILLQQEFAAYGLDKPWYVRALRYSLDLFEFKRLNSTALTTRYWPTQGSHNAWDIVLERVPFSVLLFTTSSTLTVVLAVPLALWAARRPGSLLDNVVISWSIFSVSMPWWWLAMVFIALFTVKYHVFPQPWNINVNFHDVATLVKAAALPVFTVTILSIGDSAFRLRNIFLDIFNEDFVTVARAKGLPENMVLRKHVMRAAAPPLVTIVLFAIVLSVFSGAIITELVFNWPGLGRLYWEAIYAGDIPVVLVLTYVTTLLYLVLRFILDILYTILDPRIKRA
jgi:peptide/nickel transport system permease protein